MRRIPRPSRAIDPSLPLSASIRQRVLPLPVRSALSPGRTAAAFSTTAPQSFLLPSKQDKKKHQQFVRRWQKRLLGDSEPIGAHVDPYDPTSPVRIAPEEQGEYEEVLEEEQDEQGKETNKHTRFPTYRPAEELNSDRTWVGGDAWLKQKAEADMAKEFEKLTLRTYTPLTLEMADEIEDLTGTPYTLKDGNLMMAQTVHEVTRRPYTDYNFGLHGKVRNPVHLRRCFTQAVAEVYALKQAGLDMDLSKLANRGVYDPPHWIKDTKLAKTESGDLALEFPKYASLERFLNVMQTAPEWEGAPAEEEELLVEEAEELLDPVLPQDRLPPPTMDPDTPAFKRAAVVKMEEGRKAFDFMSNRPVPRAKPVEEPVVKKAVAPEPVGEEVVVQEAAFQETTPATTSPIIHANDPAPINKIVPAAATESRHSILEQRAQQLADDFAVLRRSAQQSKSNTSMSSAEETKWRKISLDDVNVKFALYKRLFQLTGHQISDPHLSSAHTLGDLYNYLCGAAKPQPTSLFSAMHMEGQRARERAKRTDALATKKKADLGDLINLGNVELRRTKPTQIEKTIKTGLDKVMTYALYERGLLGNGRPMRTQAGQMKQRQGRSKKVVGQGQAKPEFSKPLSSKSANWLTKMTPVWEEKKTQEYQQALRWQRRLQK